MPRDTENRGRVGAPAPDVVLAELARDLRGRLSSKAIAVLVHARFAPAGWERPSFDNPILDELVREGLLRFVDARSGFERVKDGWVTPTSAGVIARAALDAAARVDIEAMLVACVPGGDVVDPQQVADNLREWFAAGPPRPGVSGARYCMVCRRPHMHLSCPQCMLLSTADAVDEARSRDFQRTHELLSGLEDCAVTVPDEWHEKPLLRFTGAHDEGDSSVGIGAQSGWVLVADQAGTVLGDWLASNTEATPRG